MISVASVASVHEVKDSPLSRDGAPRLWVSISSWNSDRNMLIVLQAEHFPNYKHGRDVGTLRGTRYVTSLISSISERMMETASEWRSGEFRYYATNCGDEVQTASSQSFMWFKHTHHIITQSLKSIWNMSVWWWNQSIGRLKQRLAGSALGLWLWLSLPFVEFTADHEESYRLTDTRISP